MPARPTASSSPSLYTAEEVRTRLGVPPDRIDRLLAGCAAVDAACQAPGADGPILFVGTLEPRKNVRGLLLGATPRSCSRRCRRRPDLVLAGRPPHRRRGAVLRRIAGRRSPGTCTSISGM